MSKYIDLELALNELLRLYEEDVDAFGVAIPETLCIFDYHRAKEALQSLPTIEVSEDCIDRKALLEQKYKAKDIFDTEYEDWFVFVPTIEDAPSVIPKAKEGEWMEIGLATHSYKCSVCGRMLVNIIDGKKNVAKNYPYCHCGAKMKGADDE